MQQVGCILPESGSKTDFRNVVFWFLNIYRRWVRCKKKNIVWICYKRSSKSSSGEENTWTWKMAHIQHVIWEDTFTIILQSGKIVTMNSTRIPILSREGSYKNISKIYIHTVFSSSVTLFSLPVLIRNGQRLLIWCQYEKYLSPLRGWFIRDLQDALFIFPKSLITSMALCMAAGSAWIAAISIRHKSRPTLFTSMCCN